MKVAVLLCLFSLGYALEATTTSSLDETTTTSNNEIDMSSEEGVKDDMERELNVKKSTTKAIQKFDHSPYCQHCGDGGLLILCPRCPVSLHAECIGLSDPKHFTCCPHHRCNVCVMIVPPK